MFIGLLICPYRHKVDKLVIDHGDSVHIHLTNKNLPIPVSSFVPGSTIKVTNNHLGKKYKGIFE